MATCDLQRWQCCLKPTSGMLSSWTLIGQAQGKDTYPPFMNPKIAWPAGAQPFAVMLSKHDLTLLLMQFDQRLN